MVSMAACSSGALKARKARPDAVRRRGSGTPTMLRARDIGLSVFVVSRVNILPAS
jgi:hypothetical protein